MRSLVVPRLSRLPIERDRDIERDRERTDVFYRHAQPTKSVYNNPLSVRLIKVAYSTEILNLLRERLFEV